MTRAGHDGSHVSRQTRSLVLTGGRLGVTANNEMGRLAVVTLERLVQGEESKREHQWD
jgi:hypothetical protein